MTTTHKPASALQITEQANGLFSVYTDHGPNWSMADEELIAFDLSAQEAVRIQRELGEAE